jgi:hypothetical protein
MFLPTHPLPHGHKRMKQMIQKNNIMKQCNIFLNQIFLLRMKAQIPKTKKNISSYDIIYMRKKLKNLHKIYKNISSL